MKPIDDDTIAPGPPWLDRALGHLRLGQVGGLSHLADRRIAAALLVALELDRPAPVVVEAMGAVHLGWSVGPRAVTVAVRGGKVYAGTATLGPRGRVDRLRGLVAWVRGDEDGDERGEDNEGD